MGLFKKKRTTATDDYFDMELDNNDLISDDLGDDSQDLLNEDYSDDQYGGVRRKKRGSGNNILASIASVLGVVAVIAIVLVVGYLVFSLITGPSKKQCNALLADFQTASNEMNLSGVADCLEPSLGNKIKAIVVIYKRVTKKDLQDLLEMVVEGLGGEMFPSDNSDDLPDILETMSIEPVKYGLPGRKRVVKCRVSCMGIDIYWNVTVAKKDGKCFIYHVELAK